MLFVCNTCGKKFTETLELKKVIDGENLPVKVSPCCQSDDIEIIDENELEDLTAFMEEEFNLEEVEELEAIALSMGENRREDSY